MLSVARKRETKKFCLTPRLSLQLYYIPVLAPQVTGQDPEASRKPELGELASFLGRVDPWYESTVNTLCPAILKLAEMPPYLDTSRTVDPFILDVITYYVRMGTQPIYFQLYKVKVGSPLKLPGYRASLQDLLNPLALAKYWSLQVHSWLLLTASCV